MLAMGARAMSERQGMARQAGVGADPFLRSYVATICQVLTPLVGRRTIDIAAGTAWVRSLGFTDYTPVDINGEHDYWDIGTPLPERHVGAYELAVCMGALHYSPDPTVSLGEMLRTLRPGADFVVMVPWLYPPHDRDIERWRIAPRQIYAMVAESFDAIDVYNVGSLWQVPLHVAKRFIAGPFVGVSSRQLVRSTSRRVAPPVHAQSVDDLPVAWAGPLNVVVHARGFRGTEG